MHWLLLQAKIYINDTYSSIKFETVILKEDFSNMFLHLSSFKIERLLEWYQVFKS